MTRIRTLALYVKSFVVIGLLAPVMIQVVVDKVLVHNSKSTLMVLAVGIGLSYLFELILGLAKNYVFSHTTNRIDVILSSRLFKQMMEDIVLLETKISKKHCEVFRLQFAVGEYDMVVFNPAEANCEIYEIKHSKEVVPQQCRHLLDEQKCKDTEFRYGSITGKYVIYRGPTTTLSEAGFEAAEDVAYLNVEEYLKKL